MQVFVYKFTDPNDRESYDVMWDYVGGFVRISPFFKSRKHKKVSRSLPPFSASILTFRPSAVKTGPAKMLDLNKGLREVTFHMTGGNRIAQGYWVPFHCARAVCATFCHDIAGALIPIFGPSFPQDCVATDSPRFNRMVIDERIVKEAKHEIAAYRHASLTICPRSNTITSHPRRHHLSLDAMRPGNSLLPPFAPQQHQQHPHPHHRPFSHHDNRGDMGPAGYFPPPPPHQTMPWIQNAEMDDSRHSSHVGAAPGFTPINNHQMMRPDPLRAIHPQLILESQQRDPGRLPSPPPVFKRGLPTAEPPVQRRFESDIHPYKRPRLQSQHIQMPAHEPQRYGHPGPETPPWHDTRDPVTHPVAGSTPVMPLADRRIERSKYDEREGLEKTAASPKHDASDKPTDYTMEELQAAQVLATITQPPQATPKAKVEKQHKAVKIPKKRARSI